MDIVTCAKKVFDSEIDGLSIMQNMINEDFAKAVNLIHGISGHVIVSGMGKPGHIGKKISATLASTGTKSFFLHPAEASHGDLGVISQDDILLVISYSGETQELFPMLTYAKRFGIPVIGITSNKNTSLGKSSTVLIEMPRVQEACPNNLAPTTSSTIMLALGDAIAVSLLELRNFSKDDFKQLHPGGALGKKLLKVNDLMHKNMPICQKNDSMSDVILTMTKMAFGCAGVVDECQNLIGIITDGDLRRHLSNDLLTKTAFDVMTNSPLTIGQDIFATEATKIMNEKKITSLFVVDKNLPIGIIHIHDCLRAGLA